MANNEVDFSDFEDFRKAIDKIERDFKKTPVWLKASAIYMMKEVRTRFTKSVTVDGKKMKPIKESSYKASRRPGAKGYKVKDPKNGLMPISVARPFVVKGSDMSRSAYQLDEDSARIGPVAGSHKSKFDTIWTPHHSPEYTGVSRTGRPPSPMPDRSIYGMNDRNIKWIEKVSQKEIEKNIDKNLKSEGL